MAGRNYSCTASGQNRSPLSGKEDGNVVVMTTEVFVKNQGDGRKARNIEDTIEEINGRSDLGEFADAGY